MSVLYSLKKALATTREALYNQLKPKLRPKIDSINIYFDIFNLENTNLKLEIPNIFQCAKYAKFKLFLELEPEVYLIYWCLQFGILIICDLSV